ncbi:MAG: hypothetical protein KJ718_02820 [Nanoarchaeota archaeon]|nr:hypothetical protein [Nanoarchaeota archaeon]MBU1051461.1 hypothetical protein [Nanoarchaeota archaeon]
MSEDSLIDFLEGAFPPSESKRCTLSIPAGSVREGRIAEEVIKKLEECFEEWVGKGVVYFRQRGDGSYEVRSYAPVE